MSGENLSRCGRKEMEIAKKQVPEDSQVSSLVSKKCQVFVPFSAIPIPPAVQPGQSS